MKIEWRGDSSLGWHIYAGPSLFLVAEGSGWSRPFGKLVYLAAKVYYWFVR